MKKLIKLLLVTTFTTAPVVSVIACNPGTGPGINLTQLQQDMVQGAEFISRLIIAGRHENLNYNVNEILSMYLTPGPTALRIPLNYKYDNKNYNAAINLTKYKNLLAPGLVNYDGDNYAGMYASYVMGMYENDFYENIIKGDSNGNYYFEDTFSKDGKTGNNKIDNKNAMGYAAGLGNQYDLASESARKELAWAIQDTGALSNYLLLNDFDGGFPGDTNGTSGPASAPTINKGGTNGAGYAFYNSILYNGKAKYNANSGGKAKLGVNDKLNSNLNFQSASNKKFNSTIIKNDTEISFNSTGALLSETAGKQNINGYINLFASMLDNIAETDNGALVLSEFLSYTMPILVEKGGLGDSITTMQGVAFSLLTNTWKAFNNINENENLKQYLSDKGFNIKNLNNLKKSLNPVDYWFGIPLPHPDQIGVDKLQKYEEDIRLLIELIEELINVYNRLKTNTEKEEFAQKFFLKSKATSPFYKAYNDIIKSISIEVWNEAVTENGQGAINLLNLVKRSYEDAISPEYIQAVEQIEQLAGDTTNFRDLTNVQKQQYVKIMGYENGKFKEGSPLARAYEGLKDSNSPGSEEFKILFDGFKNATNEGMKEVHKNVLQYILDDKYWDISDTELSSTSNVQTGATMKFSLEYKGVGDSTSNASEQTKKVEVNDKFNPYQTLEKHQKDEIGKLKQQKLIDEEKLENSGKVLGVEQEIIDKKDVFNYDGLGDYNNYRDVNFKYDIVWENISKDRDNPYWVITSIECYNQKGERFYNIY